MIESPVHEPSVRLKVSEFLDNIEKNGWTQTFGSIFNEDAISDSKVDKDKVTEACAFGQGMLNSDIYIFDDSSNICRNLYKDISRWNDWDKLDIQTIVNLARQKYKDVLDAEIKGWNYEDYISGNIPVAYAMNRV